MGSLSHYVGEVRYCIQLSLNTLLEWSILRVALHPARFQIIVR